MLLYAVTGIEVTYRVLRLVTVLIAVSSDILIIIHHHYWTNKRVAANTTWVSRTNIKLVLVLVSTEVLIRSWTNCGPIGIHMMLIHLNILPFSN